MRMTVSCSAHDALRDGSPSLPIGAEADVVAAGVGDGGLAHAPGLVLDRFRLQARGGQPGVPGVRVVDVEVQLLY